MNTRLSPATLAALRPPPPDDPDPLAAMKYGVDMRNACRCPVCRVPLSNPDDAADCCLWRDLDITQRREAARKVHTTDATWTEALGI